MAAIEITQNPKPGTSRNNSIDPPANLSDDTNLSRKNSIYHTGNLTHSRNNNMDQQNNSQNRDHVENLPREVYTLPKECSIVLDQMILGINRDENQDTLKNQKTMETVIRTRLLKFNSSTKMNPNRSVEFEGSGMDVGTSTQHG